MIDELRLNTKLLAYDGVIGRRDYFLNIIYLCMLSTLFMTPLSIHCVTHTESLLDFFKMNQLFLSASWFLKLWVVAGTIGILYVSLSNMVRRLNDINGKVEQELNISFGVLSVLGAFSYALPLSLMFVFGAASTILFLYLVIKEGKVTKNFPYDFRKDFNWGAFFGTWIWGLINKSYVTLWVWILSLTPVGFYFQLLCGLKGNEWAYKNKKWKSDVDFKASQEKQSIAFVILNFIVFPFLCVVLTMVIIFGLAFATINETKNSPGQQPVLMEKLENGLNSFTSLYFESYTITKTENKFYVLPEDWNKYSFAEKKDILNMAATKAAGERNKSGRIHSTKSNELPRTKIYSSTTKELLGEFVLNEAVFQTDKPNFKSIIKETMNAYRFYRAGR